MRRTMFATVLTLVLLLISMPIVATADAARTATAAPAGPVRVVAQADTEVLAQRRVTRMSLREMAASVIMGHIPTTDLETLAAYMGREQLGGFILMGPNVPPSEADLRAITSALTLDGDFPPLIGIDQEGGDVSRLPWDDLPSAVTLKDEPADASRDAFAARGALLMRAGIGVNFGVVADMTADPSMFIFRRALGTAPDTAAERVGGAVQGEGDQVLTTLKHFPGHGAAPGDSHGGIPTTDEPLSDWAASDAVPFTAGIDAGAPVLMFGHLAYTAVDSAPATLSAEWHRIARADLGFTGLAITDDLGMLQASGIPTYDDPVANAVAALAAGNDMLLAIMFTDADSASRMIDGIVAAVEAGTLPEPRLEEAALRVAQARIELAAAGRAFTGCADCAPVG